MLHSAVLERLMEKVSPEPNSGCWLWTGCANRFGYGRFRIDGHMRVAHRVVYEAHKGSVPDGLVLDHLCRVRCCVNPDHLEPVTKIENDRRGISGAVCAARYRAMTHCSNGHEFTPRNTRLFVDGEGITCRACRACAVERTMRYRLRYGRQGTASNPRRSS
jgi:hypothetical protein